MATITTHRVSRVYEPMSLSISIEVQGTGLDQKHDLSTGEVSPSRGVAPTFLVPRVRGAAGDGSVDPSKDITPASVTWRVNGSPIAEAWRQGEDFTVANASDAAGRPKGTLVIYKDLTSGEVAVIDAAITVADTRLSKNITAQSEQATLKCVGKSDTTWEVGTPTPRAFTYNPAADTLDDYDWRKGNGGLAAGEAAPAQWGCYLLEYPVYVKRGARTLDPADFTIKVEKVDADGNAVADPLPLEYAIESGKVTFDMRLIDTATYRVSAIAGGKAAGVFNVRLRRSTPTLAYEMLNNGGIAAGHTMRTDRLAVRTRGNVVASPDRLVRVTWGAKVDGGAKRPLGQGVTHRARLADMGFTASSTSMELEADAEVKGAFKVAVDKSGKYFTVGGKPVIINC